MNASDLRKEQVWGERRYDMSTMGELTHICKQKPTLYFLMLVTQLNNLRFFTQNHTEFLGLHNPNSAPHTARSLGTRTRTERPESLSSSELLEFPYWNRHVWKVVKIHNSI